MVKGITRQVIVVKAPDPKLFDQAIFLVRDDVVMEGGVTEESLLQEARKICTSSTGRFTQKAHWLWAGSGAGLVGFLWLATILF